MDKSYNEKSHRINTPYKWTSHSKGISQNLSQRMDFSLNFIEINFTAKIYLTVVFVRMNPPSFPLNKRNFCIGSFPPESWPKQTEKKIRFKFYRNGRNQTEMGGFENLNNFFKISKPPFRSYFVHFFGIQFQSEVIFFRSFRSIFGKLLPLSAHFRRKLPMQWEKRGDSF